MNEENLELDHLATINKLRRNQTIIEYCTCELKAKKEFTGKNLVLMSNFSFLIKMALM